MRVGLIGTGHAARSRSQALLSDDRAQLVAVAGHTLDRATTFAQPYSAEATADWQSLVHRSDIDLIMVCHVNNGHAAAVRTALEAGKAVVVEYPLALSVDAAQELIALAQTRQLFLHVEHIELWGGLHQTLKAHLATIGRPAYVRYKTVVPKSPAPKKWSYHSEQFGFPLVGALSRLHRLTNLFGAVTAVSSQLQYDDDGGEAQPYYNTCRCTAQLTFANGVLAEVFYGKGEQVWQPARYMEIQGDRGALIFEGDQGTLLQDGISQPLTLAARRGLFAQDTAAVLDALLAGKPMYVSPQESLYALTVAAAAERSAATGQTIYLSA
ncbi:MAG: Gfo/Idh/MocA family oxidoreductase [Leptolyngbya sp. RL_3_1]|nr:Gfo/Idh/MocA family oxidoreductase [Leptolyngbya sp. RL_3_1]